MHRCIVVEPVRKLGGPDAEQVQIIDSRGPAHLLDALVHDEDRVDQHRERNRDLKGYEHRAGAIAQQGGYDGSDVEAHVLSPYWLFKYTAGATRPIRQAGYRPAARADTIASMTAQKTLIASKCVSC